MTVTPDEVMAAVTQFRAANDTALEELRTQGAANGETIATLEAANADITAGLDELREQVREAENAIARAPIAELGDKEARERAAYWLTQNQIETGAIKAGDDPIDPSDVPIDDVMAYGKAFRNYVRKGPQVAMGALIEAANELSVLSDPDGGFFVSPDTSGRIVSFIYETSPIRELASTETISTDALEGDYDLDEAGFGWVGETEARPETTTPQVGEWRIPVHEMYAEPKATQKVLDDAARDVEGWLAGKVQRRFGRGEATAFVSGDGVKRPRGFTTYPAGVPTAANFEQIEVVNSGAAAALTTDGLVDLVYKLKSELRPGSVFAMNRTTESEVRKLVDGQGNYIWQPDFTELRGAGARVLGFPVREFADLPDVAAAAEPVVFGNFAEAYLIVDRQGIRVLRDPFTQKGRVKFYTTRRVGGAVINFEALKIQTISV